MYLVLVNFCQQEELYILSEGCVLLHVHSDTLHPSWVMKSLDVHQLMDGQ